MTHCFILPSPFKSHPEEVLWFRAFLDQYIRVGGLQGREYMYSKNVYVYTYTCTCTCIRRVYMYKTVSTCTMYMELHVYSTRTLAKEPKGGKAV